MNYRRLGKTNFEISEIGYGMWGMAGWTGGDQDEIKLSLDTAVEKGVNFFDTAWAYAEGKSENMLGALLKRFPNKRLYTATKIPPKNLRWPAKAEYAFEDCYPTDHIIEYTEKSLKNLGVECIDLQQFHVWDDSWANRDEWKRCMEDLKKQGKIRATGASINRWESENCIKAIETGHIDVIQGIYNIFDQSAEDKLFAICEKYDVGYIARVPFDEGVLTGTFTKDTTFPDGDWRKSYFVKENLISSVEHADALKKDLPEGMTMAEAALRFILSNKHVSTTIPGMRKLRNVEANCSASDKGALSDEFLKILKQHRWDRLPTAWSQ